MTIAAPSGATFHAGDAVVLSRGTYQGSGGVFICFKEDVNWADVAEPNGEIRSHPVAWLAHAQQSGAGAGRTA